MDHPWTTQAVKQEIVRAWNERLYDEYKALLYQYRLTMRPPVIEIVDSLSTWGSWHPTTKRLAISRRLIEQHPWNIVLEILKHEMAHQMVSEVFCKVDQHGVHFRRACDKLAVASWAATATGTLPDKLASWREQALSEEEERLLRRAEKLLALAHSDSEHEAALAIERVRELYDRYHLDRIASRKVRDLVALIICEKKQRFSTVDSMILSILTGHFFVRAVYLTQWDAHDRKDYKAVELLGTRENVAMADYVLHYLRQRLRRLWEAYAQKTGRSGQVAARSFMIGVLAGFRDKLARPETTQSSQLTNERPETETALVAQAHQELEDFMSRRYPRLTTRRWSTGQRDQRSYEAGCSEGERLTIAKGVGAQGARPLALS